ncbi:MAG: PP2C family protein-serine/threonine phosphatase [Nocardioides sp.]
MTLRLRYAAVSDVGRVRKDNQDSGYAGPWLLTVCDGVGGAARGDIASATAIGQLRRLDAPPVPEHTEEELLGLVAGALHRAHDRIGELVDHDPALAGTSTTATIALFDGEMIAVGHVGDSRGYLFRDGHISQITHDHTFVQTLIDEGRITEAEARIHPHRNLILQAIDGTRDIEPDLFIIRLQAGDRLMLCSDGITASLDDGRLADILATGTPDYAAVELTRASLEAGTTDNVTCIVADALDAETADAAEEVPTPLLVGAAAELRKRAPLTARTSLFRGHRNGDTGELEPINAELLEPDAAATVRAEAAAAAVGSGEVPAEAIANDPLDAERRRYALQPHRGGARAWIRGILALLLVVGLVWIVAAAGWSWTQKQWYVGEQDGKVTIFRGVHTTLLGFDLSTAYQTSDLEVGQLPDTYADQIRDGIHRDSLEQARTKVQELLCTASSPGSGCA